MGANSLHPNIIGKHINMVVHIQLKNLNGLNVDSIEMTSNLYQIDCEI